MKMQWMIVPAICLGLLSVDALAQKPKAKKSDKVVLKTSNDSVSYVVGMNLGANIQTNMAKDSLNLATDLIVAGLVDAFAGKQALTQEQAQEVMIGLQTRLMARAQAASGGQSQEQHHTQPQAQSPEDQARAAQLNLQAGQTFLAQNKNRPGVITTASGLQYEVLTPGTGQSPTAADAVKVHYEGKLLDGSIFDSSVQRGEPISFPLSGVIAGWTEGLQLMKVGAKYRFFIPSDLAYGPQGYPGSPIGPNATLIFDVELLGIGQ